jgi:hypothetical protein
VFKTGIQVALIEITEGIILERDISIIVKRPMQSLYSTSDERSKEEARLINCLSEELCAVLALGSRSKNLVVAAKKK